MQMLTLRCNFRRSSVKRTLARRPKRSRLTSRFGVTQFLFLHTNPGRDTHTLTHSCSHVESQRCVLFMLPLSTHSDSVIAGFLLETCARKHRPHTDSNQLHLQLLNRYKYASAQAVLQAVSFSDRLFFLSTRDAQQRSGFFLACKILCALRNGLNYGPYSGVICVAFNLFRCWRAWCPTHGQPEQRAVTWPTPCWMGPTVSCYLGRPPRDGFLWSRSR